MLHYALGKRDEPLFTIDQDTGSHIPFESQGISIGDTCSFQTIGWKERKEREKGRKKQEFMFRSFPAWPSPLLHKLLSILIIHHLIIKILRKEGQNKERK